MSSRKTQPISELRRIFAFQSPHRSYALPRLSPETGGRHVQVRARSRRGGSDRRFRTTGVLGFEVSHAQSGPHRLGIQRQDHALSAHDQRQGDGARGTRKGRGHDWRFEGSRWATRPAHRDVQPEETGTGDGGIFRPGDSWRSRRRATASGWYLPSPIPVLASQPARSKSCFAPLRKRAKQCRNATAAPDWVLPS